MVGTATFFTDSCFTPVYCKCTGWYFLHFDKGEVFCTPSWAAFASLVPRSSAQSHTPGTASSSFSGFLYLLCLPVVFLTLIHRCVTLIPLPLRHVFIIQNSKGQRYLCMLWEHWEHWQQQKDVSMDTVLKIWVSASCSTLCTWDILRTQLSLPSYTTDLVIGDLALLWLKSFAVSAIPSIKKLSGFVELSWVQ